MAERAFAIGRCFSDGYAAFRANLGTAILGYVVFVLIAGALQVIPVIGFIAPILLAGPLEGGLIILLLNLAKNRNPSIDDLFKGFNSYGKFLGAYWLRTLIYMGIMFIFLLPVILMAGQILPELFMGDVQALAPDRLALARANLPPVIGVIVLGTVVAAIILIRWIFVFFVLAEDPVKYSVLDAFRRSAELTRGNRVGLFVASMLAGLLAAAGALLCLIGLLATVPIAACAMASAYLQLAESDQGDGRRRSSFPSATVPPPVSSPSGYTASTPPQQPPSTWLFPPPGTAIPSRPAAASPSGQPASASPPGTEQTAAQPINFTPCMTRFMEPLRIDQSTVNFALRDQTSFLANGTPVTSLALSPDGSLIAAAGQDGTIKLWDRYRRARLAEFRTGLLPVDSVAVGPDRQTILVGCRDSDQPDKRLVKAFTAAGVEKNRYAPHTLPVSGLAFSPRGDKVASIGWDRSVRISEADSGAVILTGTHRQRGLAVAFTFDGIHAVSASQDGTLIVWHLQTATAVATWSAVTPVVLQAVFSAGAEWLAVRNEAGQANLIEVRSGRTVADWTAPGKLCALHASAEGSVVAWEAKGSALRAWHVQGRRGLPELAEHRQEIECIAVSPDGMCVVSSGKDGLIGIWEAV